jgi:hypothetical protein
MLIGFPEVSLEGFLEKGFRARWIGSLGTNEGMDLSVWLFQPRL